MSDTGERNLRVYLDEVAAGTPAPGGGSVAALAGALAAALAEMVINLTLGRAKYASVEDELRPMGSRLSDLRMILLQTMAEDEAAYQSYRDASNLPRTTEAESTERAEAIQQTLIEATTVPLAVARAARETAEILEIVATKGNPHVRSDAALGAILSEAALRGALLNVRGNTRLIKDDGFSAAALAEADLLESAARDAADRAYRIAMGDPDESGIR